MLAKGWFDRLLARMVGVAAIAIASVYVYRHFNPQEPVIIERNGLNPVALAGWEDALEHAVVEGLPDAAVKVVVVSDIECPACASFSEVGSSLVSERSDMAVFTVFTALRQHRFARMATRAVECARREGRALPMLKTLYSSQDSLGLKPWPSIARTVGGIDVAEWDRCRAGSQPLSNAEFGEEFAKRIGLRATPTVIVNGWRLSRVPTDVELREMADSIVGNAVSAEGSRTQ